MTLPRSLRAAAVLAICAVAVGGAACTVGRALWSPADLPPEAEQHLAPTADGWMLQLVHYKPAKQLPGRRPLLLVHGVVTNVRNLDYDARHSLARAMARRGLDAWALSLRSTGGSTHAGLLTDYKYDWDFDTYCTQDLPAALAYV